MGSRTCGVGASPRHHRCGLSFPASIDGHCVGASAPLSQSRRGRPSATADWSVDDTSGDHGGGNDTTTPPDDTPPSSGGLCEGPCDDHDLCGGPYDMCLRNNQTGETFCSQFCQSAGGCPGGYQCVSINGLGQCVPTSQSCGEVEPPPTCDVPCGDGEVCVDGQCVEGGQWEAELQHCVDVVNDYRAQHGRSQLTRDASVEACAMEAAQQDAATGQAHGHFQRTGGCGGVARAENEVPGWPLSMYGSVMNIVEQGAAMMMDEGPGGGHYENILGSSHTRVGCGIFVTSQNAVWVVHNFR